MWGEEEKAELEAPLAKWVGMMENFSLGLICLGHSVHTSFGRINLLTLESNRPEETVEREKGESEVFFQNVTPEHQAKWWYEMMIMITYSDSLASSCSPPSNMSAGEWKYCGWSLCATGMCFEWLLFIILLASLRFSAFTLQGLHVSTNISIDNDNRWRRVAWWGEKWIVADISVDFEWFRLDSRKLFSFSFVMTDRHHFFTNLLRSPGGGRRRGNKWWSWARFCSFMGRRKLIKDG